MRYHDSCLDQSAAFPMFSYSYFLFNGSACLSFVPSVNFKQKQKNMQNCSSHTFIEGSSLDPSPYIEQSGPVCILSKLSKRSSLTNLEVWDRAMHLFRFTL